MKCPTCKREVDAATVGQKNSPFPFCCERCKLIDLGRWLDGKYQIPAEIADEDEPAIDDTPQTLDE
jgi:uncharacterized protein